ncbi:hypothetical protein AAF712_003150, partial [Marasmius tenuissimus]
LGLHRESSRMKHIPEEHEKRRYIFWELLNLDCRMSLSLGRPPSICLAHVDIKPPAYDAQGMYVPKEEILCRSHEFFYLLPVISLIALSPDHEWKNSFFIKCLTPALETIISVKPLEYSATLALDARIRDFAVPELLDDRAGNPAPKRFLAMQRALLSTGRDIVLLQLHRRYFIQTMSSPVSFELQHNYAPSVLATYLSASSIITAVETLFECEAQLSARFLCFWFNSFSAAVTLALLVSRAPACPIAPCALNDLDKVCRLFRQAGKILPFSGKASPYIHALTEKASGNYMEWRKQVGVEQIGNSSQLRLGELGSGPPPSFSNAHFSLRQQFERLKVETPHVPQFTPVHSGSTGGAVDHLLPASNRVWLPDIYNFNSVGLGVEDRYRPEEVEYADAPDNPFMPSEPRVNGVHSFNFDHGALMTDLEETSFMAWF